MTSPGVVPTSGVTPPATLPATLAAAAQQIEQELNRRPNRPMILSPNAGTRLSIVHAEYLGDVGEESVRIARREGLDTVDERHVNQAVNRICQGGRGSGIATACNTIGSIIAGIGLAAWYAIFFTAGNNAGVHSSSEYIVAAVASILAGILLTAGIVLTVMRPR